MKIMIKYSKIFSITKKMKKLYCVACNKYRKFEKPKISYVLEKTLVLSIICKKCKKWRWKIILRRRINWEIKNSWFNLKYSITFKIWQKKTFFKNLDWKI